MSEVRSVGEAPPVGRDEPSTGVPRPPSEGYAWYVVGLLTLVYVLSFLDRQILSLMVVDLKQGLDL